MRADELIKVSAMAYLVASLIFSAGVAEHALAQESAKDLQGTADHFIEEAKQKFEAGDARGALTDFDSAVKIDPKGTSSYCLRAFCRDSIGDYNGALADCNQALGLDPEGDPAPYLQRAITEYHLDRYDDCIRDCDIVLKRKPEESVTYRFRAQANVAKGNLKSALADCDLYLKATPTDNKAVQFRNHVLADMQRADMEIARGHEAGQQTPRVRLKHQLQTFGFGAHKFDLLPPENSCMQEGGGGPPHEHMKTFLFICPQESAEKPPILEVIIVTAAPGEPTPSAQKLLDSIINPYRQHLAAYVEESNKQMIVSGLPFQGAYFSGSFGSDSVRGFVFAVHEKDVSYVIMGQSRAKSFDETMKIFVDSLKTCKFHS